MKTEHGLLLGAGVLALTAGAYVYNKETGKLEKIFGKANKQQIAPAQTSYQTPSKITTPSYSTSGGITSRSPKSEIIRLQKALIDSGHLAPTQRTRTGTMVSSADGIWGKMTQTAVEKAGLSVPISESELSRLRPSSSSAAVSKLPQNTQEIAAFISKEMRSFTTDYASILEMLKDKTATQIKAIDTAYRQYSAAGLKKDFQDTTNGGKVSWATPNVTQIRQILSESGLSGTGQQVATKHACTIADRNKGDVAIGKNVILGTVIRSKPDERLYLIRTKDNGQVIASMDDVKIIQ